MKEYYFGSPALAYLLAADPRERYFRRIHNSELAKALLKGLPRRALDEDTVERINRVLEAHYECTVDDFANFDLYKKFVEEVKGACNPGDMEAFYKAFGLDGAGSCFQEPKSIVPEEIAKQIEYNNHIVFRALNYPSSYMTPLMSYFLTLEKDIEAYPYDLKEYFEKASSLEEFIRLMKSEKESGWSSKYEGKMTPSLFKALKGFGDDSDLIVEDEDEDEDEDESLAEDEPLVKDNSPDLDIINDSLKSVQKKMKDSINSQRDRFKFLLDVEPIHLYNPAFRGAALKRKEEMKAYYKELSDDNGLILDQIKRQCNELEGRLKEMNDAGLDLEVSANAKLYSKLKKELDLAYEALDFHEQVRNKLSDKDSGIIKTLDDALESKKAYLFKDEGVKRTIMSRRELLDYEPELDDLSVGHSIEILDKESVSKLVLADREVQPSEIEVVDMVFQEGATKIHGSYSVDYHVAGHASVKGEVLSKSPGGRFEVRQFPKLEDPANATREAQALLVNAKIKFAMTMAAEALANMDAPPTKERPLRVNASQEDMEFLWTALVVLGVDPKAIKINRLGTCNFTPEETIVPFLNISLGWKKSILYERMKVRAQEHIESLSDVTKQKLGATSQDKKTIAELSKTMTQHEATKEKFRSFRAEAKKDIEKEEAKEPLRSMIK